MDQYGLKSNRKAPGAYSIALLRFLILAPGMLLGGFPKRDNSMNFHKDSVKFANQSRQAARAYGSNPTYNAAFGAPNAAYYPAFRTHNAAYNSYSQAYNHPAFGVCNPAYSNNGVCNPAYSNNGANPLIPQPNPAATVHKHTSTVYINRPTYKRITKIHENYAIPQESPMNSDDSMSFDLVEVHCIQNEDPICPANNLSNASSGYSPSIISRNRSSSSNASSGYSSLSNASSTRSLINNARECHKCSQPHLDASKVKDIPHSRFLCTSCMNSLLDSKRSLLATKCAYCYEYLDFNSIITYVKDVALRRMCFRGYENAGCDALAVKIINNILESGMPEMLLFSLRLNKVELWVFMAFLNNNINSITSGYGAVLVEMIKQTLANWSCVSDTAAWKNISYINKEQKRACLYEKMLRFECEYNGLVNDEILMRKSHADSTKISNGVKKYLETCVNEGMLEMNIGNNGIDKDIGNSGIDKEVDNGVQFLKIESPISNEELIRKTKNLRSKQDKLMENHIKDMMDILAQETQEIPLVKEFVYSRVVCIMRLFNKFKIQKMCNKLLQKVMNTITELERPVSLQIVSCIYQGSNTQEALDWMTIRSLFYPRAMGANLIPPSKQYTRSDKFIHSLNSLVDQMSSILRSITTLKNEAIRLVHSAPFSNLPHLPDANSGVLPLSSASPPGKPYYSQLWIDLERDYLAEATLCLSTFYKNYKRTEERLDHTLDFYAITKGFKYLDQLGSLIISDVSNLLCELDTFKMLKVLDKKKFVNPELAFSIIISKLMGRGSTTHLLSAFIKIISRTNKSVHLTHSSIASYEFLNSHAFNPVNNGGCLANLTNNYFVDYLRAYAIFIIRSHNLGLPLKDLVPYIEVYNNCISYYHQDLDSIWTKKKPFSSVCHLYGLHLYLHELADAAIESNALPAKFLIRKYPELRNKAVYDTICTKLAGFLKKMYVPWTKELLENCIRVVFNKGARQPCNNSSNQKQEIWEAGHHSFISNTISALVSAERSSASVYMKYVRRNEYFTYLVLAHIKYYCHCRTTRYDGSLGNQLGYDEIDASTDSDGDADAANKSVDDDGAFNDCTDTGDLLETDDVLNDSYSYMLDYDYSRPFSDMPSGKNADAAAMGLPSNSKANEENLTASAVKDILERLAVYKQENDLGILKSANNRIECKKLMWSLIDCIYLADYERGLGAQSKELHDELLQIVKTIAEAYLGANSKCGTLLGLDHLIALGEILTEHELRNEMTQFRPKIN